MFENIKFGDRVEISFTKSISGQAFVSQVDDVKGDNELLVLMPISYGQMVKLPVGDNYSMLFYTANGMIKFKAGITGYEKDGGIYLIEVKILDQGEKIQRRGHFRLTSVLPMKVAKVSNDLSLAGSEDLLEAVVKDISGGGARFVSNCDMNEGNRVKCVITIEEDCVIIIGQILRKQHFPKSKYQYQYRAKFTGMTAEDEEKIVQYIFSEQRKELIKQRQKESMGGF